MNTEVLNYIDSKDDDTRHICERLLSEITEGLLEASVKMWHGHPVWFLDGNPIVGFSKLKSGTRLMFWSGADFDEPNLNNGSGKFKDASITFTSVDEIDSKELLRWLHKSKDIQWDYKNLVKRKGLLEKL